MKLTHVLLLGGLALLPAGCHHPRADGTSTVKTVVAGGREFPALLAGRWVADRHGWEIVLERDGRISSAVISLGRVHVTPGRTTTIPTKSGSQAVFTPGSWLVHCEPDTRTLTVKIVMDHVRAEMAGNILEGSSTDVFAGSVSPTGDTWQTEWTTFTCYTARTPEGTSFDLSTDPVYGETEPLLFHKTPAPPR